MRLCITFSGAPYEKTTQRIVEDAPKFGVDDVWVYDDRWLLQQDFYERNRWLWEHAHKRGFGWYAWKPFVIWDALSRLKSGDIVLYVDADCVPIAPLNVLFEQCERDDGIMVFASENHKQSDWCKRDCYIVMGQDDPIYYDVPAGVARFMLFQKGPWAVMQFLMEWLTYCVNFRATTFDASVLGEELPGFVEHRTEQAIFSNLAHKYGLNLYREADGAGANIDRNQDLYGQLFRQIDVPGPKVTACPVGSSYFRLPSLA